MKNIIKYIFLILITAILSITMISCNGKKHRPPKNNNGGVHETIIKDTDFYFAQGGSTEYKIVISENANSNDDMAVKELQLFLKEACSVEIPVIIDSQAVYSEDSKYISVGRNKLFERSGIVIDDDKYKTSGYRILSKGKIVFLTGSNYKNNNYGVIYAAYGFLEHLIGLKIYTDVCYTLNANPTVKMVDYDVTAIPDYDWRSLGYYGVTSSYNRRLRLLSGDANVLGNTHTHFMYLPKDKYFNTHRDWYNSEGTQLRLINEEMTLEFIEQAKNILRNNPEATLLFIGMEDRDVPFSPEDARLTKEKYNTNEAGLNIVFVNKVAKAIDEWIETEFPGRRITYRTILYCMHYEAPVEYDEETDTFTPHSAYVIPRPNVNLHIAPIGMPSYVKPISHASNRSVDINIRKWASISNNISMYNYAINFRNYLMNFNDFGSFQANLVYGLENGFNGWYQQSSLNSYSPAFTELRLYVQSQLLWNTSLSHQELARDFINAYYGKAAEWIWEYYNLSLTNNVVNVEEKKAPQGTTSGNPAQANFYPFELVNRMATVMERAELALEPLLAEDPVLYYEYLNRVRIQKATVLYLQLNHYLNYYSKSEINSMLDELEITCSKNSIMRVDESDPADAMLSFVQRIRQANS